MERPQHIEETFWQQLVQPFKNWLAERRGDDARREDEETSETDGILFETLSPVAMPNALLLSFGELTEAWIKRQCDALTYDQARWYPRNQQVSLLDANPLRICALTNGRSTYRQEISLQDGQMVATCTCRAGQNSAEAPDADKRCRHVIAALLTYYKLQGPPPAPTTSTDCLCPVTRQPITKSRTIYQCRQCQTSYSPEGWEFLQQSDQGRCSTCHQRKTIAPLR